MHKTKRIRCLTLGLLLAGGSVLPAQDQPALPGQLLPPAAPPAAVMDAGGGCPGQERTAAGCWDRFRDCVQDSFLGYLSQYDAPPLGATIGRHFQIQVRNADPDRLMLHDFDFVCGTGQLNCRGQERLTRMVAMLAKGAPAVLIEVVPCCPGLSEARRLSVHNALLARGVPVAVARVAVAAPQGLPKSGVEALITYSNLLRQTQSVGTSPGTTAISGGFAPGGFTSGGAAAAGIAPGGASPGGAVLGGGAPLGAGGLP